VTLIRNKGPQWKELASHYQNRYLFLTKVERRSQKALSDSTKKNYRKDDLSPQTQRRAQPQSDVQIIKGTNGGDEPRDVCRPRPDPEVKGYISTHSELIANMLTYNDLEMKD
jgi:hypothetical protein